MNIVGSLVGLSIMGAAAPMVAEMSIQPFQAQKRAQNFSIAESLAVTYAAANEGQTTTASVPASCVLSDIGPDAHSISCTAGSDQYVQTVARSFRLQTPLSVGGVAATREFAYERPLKFNGHQCPPDDPWGVYRFNDTYYTSLNGACLPQVVWTPGTYKESDPDNWLYDINNHNGWGEHADY